MTIAVSADRFGSGSLGSKSRWRPMTARMDKPIQHPVYRWKQTTRRELRAEAKKHREWQGALDRKWERITEQRTTEKNAKFRKRWDAHIEERSKRRVSL